MSVDGSEPTSCLLPEHALTSSSQPKRNKRDMTGISDVIYVPDARDEVGEFVVACIARRCVG